MVADIGGGGHDPSDLLALLAGLIVKAGFEDIAGARLNAAIDAASDVDGGEPPAEWLVDAADLCRSVVRELGGFMPTVFPDSIADAALFVEQLQRLDRWHTPLLAHRRDLPRSTAHERALNRLVEAQPRFNRDPELGSVIPGRSPSLPFFEDFAEHDGPVAPRGALGRLLDVTSYLPPSLMAAYADDEATDKSPRPVKLRFAQSASRDAGGGATGEPLVVAVAPLAEGAEDLTLEVSGDRYGIMPIYSPDRINLVVERAVAAGAHLLCMPEMTVAEGELARLSAAIVNARRAFLDRTGKTPKLRYVIAGITAPPRADGERHRNYAVCLDRNGAIILQQHKLRHWNLGNSCQKRFAIVERFGLTALPPLLHEDTDPATTMTIADLDGLGRLFTLICADMDQDAPGDWLLANLHIDWLIAPIMDGSTCWAQDGAPPWIIGRAIRAAERGNVRIVVNNSVTMTRWNNDSIAATIAAHGSCPFALYEHCGIALLLDSTGPAMRQAHLKVHLADETSPVVAIQCWDEDWPDLPT